MNDNKRPTNMVYPRVKTIVVKTFYEFSVYRITMWCDSVMTTSI